MKLDTYLRQHDLSAAEFGRRVRVSRSAVIRWISGARLPDRDSMHRIVAATAGAVQPNDFFAPPAADLGAEPTPEATP